MHDEIYEEIIKKLDDLLMEACNTFNTVIREYNNDVNLKYQKSYTIDEAINMYSYNYNEKIKTICAKYKNIDCSDIKNYYNEQLENKVIMFKQMMIELNNDSVGSNSNDIGTMPKLTI